MAFKSGYVQFVVFLALQARLKLPLRLPLPLPGRPEAGSAAAAGTILHTKGTIGPPGRPGTDSAAPTCASQSPEAKTARPKEPTGRRHPANAHT